MKKYLGIAIIVLGVAIFWLFQPTPTPTLGVQTIEQKLEGKNAKERANIKAVRKAIDVE